MSCVLKGIAVTLLALAILTTGCEKESGNDRSYFSQYIRTGTRAIDFTARRMDDKKIALSNFKGKVILMTFWKRRCKECVRNLDNLEALYERFKARGLVVIAVNADNLDYVPSHRIKELVKRKAYTFPVLFDDFYVIAETYKLTKIPVTYLIDREGTISSIHYGEEDWMSLENIKRLEKLL